MRELGVSRVCLARVRRKERRAEARRLVDEEQCERERGAGTEGKKPRGAPAARRVGGRADGERDDDRENRVFRDQRPAGEESREDGAAVSLSRVCLVAGLAQEVPREKKEGGRPGMAEERPRVVEKGRAERDGERDDRGDRLPFPPEQETPGETSESEHRGE